MVFHCWYVLPIFTPSCLGPYLSTTPLQWASSSFCSKNSVVYLSSHTKPQSFLDPHFFSQPVQLLLVSALLPIWSTCSIQLQGPALPRDGAEWELEGSPVLQPLALGQPLHLLGPRGWSRSLGRCLQDGQVAVFAAVFRPPL